MPILKQGSSGPAVKDLQQKLKKLGFDPKGVDGKFGPGTLAAVKAFQKSKKLGADGLVGPKTLAALGAAVSAAGGGKTSGAAKSSTPKSTSSNADDQSDDDLPDELLGVGIDAVARLFPGVPIKNIAENLPFVLKAMDAAN